MHNHSHHHHHGASSARTLGWSLAIILAFAVVEAVTGWWAGSLALLGDAGHMVSDATALGIALLAAWVALRPPSDRHSYGLVRAEAMAALVNGLFMLALVIAIVVAAVERLNQPQAVAGGAVFGVALLGLIVNIIVLLVLSGGEKSLNIRGAMLHVLGDLLGSVAAMIAGAVIYFTGWTPIDPILSIVICALILFSSFHLLLDVLHVIMEGVPRNIDLPEVGMALAAIEGVNSVHDLHIWTLASGKIVLTAHAEVDDMSKWPEALDSMKKFLRDQYDIDHVTIQPEPAQGVFPLQDHTGRE